MWVWVLGGGRYLAGLVFVLTSQPVTALLVRQTEAAASRHKALVPFLSSARAVNALLLPFFTHSNLIWDV